MLSSSKRSIAAPAKPKLPPPRILRAAVKRESQANRSSAEPTRVRPGVATTTLAGSLKATPIDRIVYVSWNETYQKCQL